MAARTDPTASPALSSQLNEGAYAPQCRQLDYLEGTEDGDEGCGGGGGRDSDVN